MAADEGLDRAHYQIGVLYEYGRGVRQNFPKAMRWYRRAAAQGLASAQTNIGYLYGAGLGVPKDNAEAMPWYRMGAAQGDALAQFDIGVMYEKAAASGRIMRRRCAGIAEPRTKAWRGRS